MGNAASLQALITALAYKYIFQLKINPVHIPDNPSTESERRQIFFGSAEKKDLDNFRLADIIGSLS